jgi:hypothetical protein
LNKSPSDGRIIQSSYGSCGDGLQTEEHIFWDCKLHEDQRARVMGIFSDNSKKEYPKSVTELLRLVGKRFVRDVSYFLNKIPNFIKKKKYVYKILIVYS